MARHFPADSLHQEILDTVNLSTETVTRKKRDAKFREKLLDAYQRRCAVCDFDVRVADVLVGIDAAHIRWHQFNGPATEQNGVALCVMHHKLFDFGALPSARGGSAFRARRGARRGSRNTFWRSTAARSASRLTRTSTQTLTTSPGTREKCSKARSCPASELLRGDDSTLVGVPLTPRLGPTRILFQICSSFRVRRHFL
jgi:hypothetical protein